MIGGITFDSGKPILLAVVADRGIILAFLATLGLEPASNGSSYSHGALGDAPGFDGLRVHVVVPGKNHVIIDAASVA